MPICVRFSMHVIVYTRISKRNRIIHCNEVDVYTRICDIGGPSKRANARPALDPPLAVSKEKTMRKSYHGPSAADYIRRLDRMIVCLGSIVVATGISLYFHIA